MADRVVNHINEIFIYIDNLYKTTKIEKDNIIVPIEYKELSKIDIENSKIYFEIEFDNIIEVTRKGKRIEIWLSDSYFNTSSEPHCVINNINTGYEQFYQAMTPLIRKIKANNLSDLFINPINIQEIKEWILEEMSIDERVIDENLITSKDLILTSNKYEFEIKYNNVERKIKYENGIINIERENNEIETIKISGKNIVEIVEKLSKEIIDEWEDKLSMHQDFEF